MNKKTFLSIVAVCCLLTCSQRITAQVKYLVVTQQGDRQTTFALADQPTVTTTGGELKVEDAEQSISVALAEVVHFVFAVEPPVPTTIDSTTGNAAISMRQGEVILTGLQPGSIIDVYTIDGRLCSQMRADANGSALIDMTTQGRGVFILQTQEQSLKITNK